jgi:hypothetical protein
VLELLPMKMQDVHDITIARPGRRCKYFLVDTLLNLPLAGASVTPPVHD